MDMRGDREREFFFVSRFGFIFFKLFSFFVKERERERRGRKGPFFLFYVQGRHENAFFLDVFIYKYTEQEQSEGVGKGETRKRDKE